MPVPAVTGRGITALGVEKMNGRGPDPDEQSTFRTSNVQRSTVR